MLEILELPGKFDTPYVKLDPQVGECFIEGTSYPEDVTDFYMEVVDWFKEYALIGEKDLTINFKLSYYNSASQKIYNEILLVLMECENFSTKVRWHYAEDDEDMLDAGQEFSKLFDVPIEYVAYER